MPLLPLHARRPAAQYFGSGAPSDYSFKGYRLSTPKKQRRIYGAHKSMPYRIFCSSPLRRGCSIIFLCISLVAVLFLALSTSSQFSAPSSSSAPITRRWTLPHFPRSGALGAFQPVPLSPELRRSMGASESFEEALNEALEDARLHGSEYREVVRRSVSIGEESRDRGGGGKSNKQTAQNADSRPPPPPSQPQLPPPPPPIATSTFVPGAGSRIIPYVPHVPIEFSHMYPGVTPSSTSHRFCPSLSPSTPVTVSFIVQGSADRLWLMSELCRRLISSSSTSPPPLLVAAWLPESYRTVLESEGEASFFRSLALPPASECPNLRLIPVFHQPPQAGEYIQYPVNVLRNIGLQLVQTTHYIVLDADFLPSSNVVSSIVDRHAEDLRDPTVALVLPAFEKGGPSPCNNLSHCLSLPSIGGDRGIVPATFEALKQCALDRLCGVFQSGAVRPAESNPDGHSTTNTAKWWAAEGGVEPSYDSTIDCFDSNRYEPYVVVRRCEEVSPMYDERFSGYGKNKIQFVTMLRHAGHRFKVAGGSFVVHVPHPESGVKKEWGSKHDSMQRNMSELYKRFLGELKERLGKTPTTPLCDLAMDENVAFEKKKEVWMGRNEIQHPAEP